MTCYFHAISTEFPKDLCSSLENKLRYFFDEITFWRCIDSNTTEMFKAQKGSNDIIKIVNVTSVVQPQFYEATRILFVRKENKNNDSEWMMHLWILCIAAHPKRFKIMWGGGGGGGCLSPQPSLLTSIVMKVFDRLLKNHICSSTPVTLDPLQFAYRPNRSTDDAIPSLTHIDSKNGNYVRLLFIDNSSAFNTTVPIKLAIKLTDLGLNSSLCDWIQDFLTGRPQVVKVGQFTSNSITLNVGAPQGCVPSPVLYSLYTHDCVCSHSSTSIVKFSDDTVVLGLISNNDETAYLDEVERLTLWCQDNCLSLWKWAKLKSWLWTSGSDSSGPTPFLLSVEPLRRGWAASSTSV